MRSVPRAFLVSSVKDHMQEKRLFRSVCLGEAFCESIERVIGVWEVS